MECKKTHTQASGNSLRTGNLNSNKELKSDVLCFTATMYPLRLSPSSNTPNASKSMILRARCCRQRISGDDLPNELLLQIFPLLTLQSLIAARSVDKRWRNLVSQAYISPGRKRLLELYLRAIELPAFQESRTDILPHVRGFDREDYMQHLLDDPPEEFDLWIREWPAGGIIGWIWPGLVGIGESEDWRWRCRCNCLAHVPPYIKSITYHERVGASGTTELSPTDIIYHAAAYLPVGVDIDLGGGISWIDEEESAMVSIEITVLCVCQCTTDGRRCWLVLDGKRGGEKLKGVVYLGGVGLDLRPEDIVAKSWSEFLALQLDNATRHSDPRPPNGPCSSVTIDPVEHSPKFSFALG